MTDWRYLGFGYYNGNFIRISMPYWLPTVLTLILPGWWVRRWIIDRRRRTLGLCSRCGYDLRATPGRCPECGTEVGAHAHAASHATPPVVRGLWIIMLIYISWLGMMGVHELGHVIHAHISGGQVSLVYFHPLDFSRTDLSANPHPQFVAWGGPIWGSVLPLAAYGLVCWLRLGGRKIACFFAGFCLIANGAYVGAGWVIKAGDAGTLLRHGASPWVMTVAGVLGLAAGLSVWHRLGPRFGLR